MRTCPENMKKIPTKCEEMFLSLNEGDGIKCQSTNRKQAKRNENEK